MVALAFSCTTILFWSGKENTIRTIYTHSWLLSWIWMFIYIFSHRKAVYLKLPLNIPWCLQRSLKKTFLTPENFSKKWSWFHFFIFVPHKRAPPLNAWLNYYKCLNLVRGKWGTTALLIVEKAVIRRRHFGQPWMAAILWADIPMWPPNQASQWR